jgi:hypothetical protein
VDLEPWPSGETEKYVQQLQSKGVDGDKLLRMLVGNDPDQPIKLKLLVDIVTGLAAEEAERRKRNKQVLRLVRHYRMVEKLTRTDSLFREQTLQALADDLERIDAALHYLPADVDHVRLAQFGITVKPGGKHKGNQLSHQGFWTQPMAAFVLYLHPILGTWQSAYRTVAHLFNLAFGFPDEPTLVSRRTLRHRKDAV